MAEAAVVDVVVVGAGPAGCVLANRLSEDPGRSVLLLEAGPDYGPDPGAWPAELQDPTRVLFDSHTWGYLHAGRPADRPLPLPRAKVVGGTSTVNACFWLRGSAADCDGWEAAGNPGWGFAGLLPYFRRSEADPLAGPLHGTDGPVPVFRLPEAELGPVDRALVAAAEAHGFPWVADANGDPVQRPGVGPAPKNVAGGVRMHAASTYLAPARSRPNLRVVPDALADRALVEGGRAVGVRLADGREVRGREVVLCAGAYASPAILLRSGIGPGDHLRELGIPVVADLPGVGGHLMDHPVVEVFTARVRPGHAAAPAPYIPTVLKVRSRQAAEEVDLYLYHGQRADPETGSRVLWLDASLQHARSQGRVWLTGADPHAAPEIDLRHFAEPADLEALCDGVEVGERLAATEPLASAVEPPDGGLSGREGRVALRARVRAEAGTMHHPSGTCRMGPAGDPRAVVDQAGRVRGVAGLRVADASVFPTGPRANIHCTVVAVAEKLADAIRSGKAV